jgi:hypothetical protein
MWILSILPDWVFHAIFVVGLLGTITGFVLGMIPLVQRYIIPIRVISILVLLVGTWLEGGLSDSKEWQLRVKEMEAKVAEAEAKSATENVKIVEKVVNRTQIVRERGKDIIVQIDRDRVVLDSNCVIPKEFIAIHNKAAEPVK